MKKRFFDVEYHALFYKDNDKYNYIDELFYNSSCNTLQGAIDRVYYQYENNKNLFDFAEIEIQVTEYEKEIFDNGEVNFSPLDTVSSQVLFTFRNGNFEGYNY